MMEIQVFNNSFLCFEKGEKSWALIVDPCNEWGNIKVFLQAHQIELKYILLSQASFKNALRVATIQHETGAHFLSFKSDLLPLRKLPRLADEVNVCGIKTPRIDRFLDDLEQIDIFGKTLKIKDFGGVRHYQIEKFVMPPIHE